MAPHVSETLVPTWQSVVLIVVGLAVLLLTPVIVRLNLRSQEAIFRWQRKIFGLEQTGYGALADSSKLARWQRFSYWSWCLLLGAALVTVGAGMLLTQSSATTRAAGGQNHIADDVPRH